MASISELKGMLDGPIYLQPNTFLHFYGGGKLRGEFMGEENAKDDYRSEEWIFSTNRAVTPGLENPVDKGFSRIVLPSGEVLLLKDLLEVFPEECLGRRHCNRFGPNLGVLVKIFDVGEGAHIPIHWHPTPSFAQEHLSSPFGKTEAWIIIGTRPGAKAWIGFKEAISCAEFRRLMDEQDIEAIRSLMHLIEPRTGEVIYVPPGLVHSLGSGLCVLEPQEPTDWSIIGEWEGFPYEKNVGTLGLGWDLALQAADFSKLEVEKLDTYIRRTPVTLREDGGNCEDRLLPEEASPFFQASRLVIDSRLTMRADNGCHCLVTLQGQGKLKGSFENVSISRGRSVFVPARLSEYEIVNTGCVPIEVVCCFPPLVD